MANKKIEQWDRENFFHPSTHLANFEKGELASRVINSGSGVFIKDENGNEFLDGFAGLSCVNVGYGQQKVIDAITEQANELSYYHAYIGHGTSASITLAKMIIDRMPENFSKVYFGLTGSDANETAVKIIWYYNNCLNRPNKKKIISRWRGYHGSGLISGSLTGLQLFHQQFDLPFSQIIHTKAPYYYRRTDDEMTEEEFSLHCARELENLIEREGAENIAAMFAEPVLGTGGLVPPPKGYWQAVTPILEKNDILLVSDEVISGFGRTGAMFGAIKYGMKPDIITTAKGLTSAYAPLSATTVSNKVWQTLLVGSEQYGVFGHGSTYSAHPIGVAAGVANLKLVDELDLINHANRNGEYLKQRLVEEISHFPNVGQIRGVGLLVAVEFCQDQSTRKLFNPLGHYGVKLASKMLEKKVIVRSMPEGDIIGIAPPLVINQQEIETIVMAVKQSIIEVFD